MADNQPAEAMVELEAARTLAPTDAVVLSELGWAAFNAGKYDVAKTTTDEAIRLAKNPKLKAASLYNLGRIAEQAGDSDAAKKAYEESIAIRPHEVVSRRLAQLDSPTRALPTSCNQPTSARALCDCLFDETFFDDGMAEEPKPPTPGRGSCHTIGTTGGVQLWKVGVAANFSESTGYALVIERDNASYAIATLASGLNGGRRHVREFKLGTMTVRKAGGRSYLWVENDLWDYDEEHHGEGIETKEHLITVCPFPVDPGATITCPLHIPATREMTVTLDKTDPEAIAEFKNQWGTPPPFKGSAELSVTVDPTGTATVKLVRGKPVPVQAAHIGSTKLW